MQAHDVALAEEVVESDKLATPWENRQSGTLVRCQHLHSHRQCHLGRRPADSSETDQSHRQSGQFHQRKIPVAEIGASAPAPLGDPAGVIGHVQREIQQMGEDHLHDRWRGIVGHVADRDAPLARGGNVDNVVARGRHADVPQPRQPGDGFPRNLDLVGQNDVGLGRAGDQLLGQTSCRRRCMAREPPGRPSSGHQD